MATLALGAASGLQLSRAPIDLEYLRRDGAHLWSTGLNAICPRTSTRQRHACKPTSVAIPAADPTYSVFPKLARSKVAFGFVVLVLYAAYLSVAAAAVHTQRKQGPVAASRPNGDEYELNKA
ncbi:MAG: hypothetical protein LQ346_008799 [Caloplaca aetnensis]|nr:MAG: hypothetical protein LQ346_008799 [Caloplaca aetnensis]